MYKKNHFAVLAFVMFTCVVGHTANPFKNFRCKRCPSPYNQIIAVVKKNAAIVLIGKITKPYTVSLYDYSDTIKAEKAPFVIEVEKILKINITLPEHCWDIENCNSKIKKAYYDNKEPMSDWFDSDEFRKQRKNSIGVIKAKIKSMKTISVENSQTACGRYIKPDLNQRYLFFVFTDYTLERFRINGQCRPAPLALDDENNANMFRGNSYIKVGIEEFFR